MSVINFKALEQSFKKKYPSYFKSMKLYTIFFVLGLFSFCVLSIGLFFEFKALIIVGVGGIFLSILLGFFFYLLMIIFCIKNILFKNKK